MFKIKTFWRLYIVNYGGNRIPLSTRPGAPVSDFPSKKVANEWIIENGKQYEGVTIEAKELQTVERVVEAQAAGD